MFFFNCSCSRSGSEATIYVMCVGMKPATMPMTLSINELSPSFSSLPLFPSFCLSFYLLYSFCTLTNLKSTGDPSARVSLRERPPCGMFLSSSFSLFFCFVFLVFLLLFLLFHLDNLSIQFVNLLVNLDITQLYPHNLGVSLPSSSHPLPSLSPFSPFPSSPSLPSSLLLSRSLTLFL